MVAFSQCKFIHYTQRLKTRSHSRVRSGHRNSGVPVEPLRRWWSVTGFVFFVFLCAPVVVHIALSAIICPTDRRLSHADVADSLVSQCLWSEQTGRLVRSRPSIDQLMVIMAFLICSLEASTRRPFNGTALYSIVCRVFPFGPSLLTLSSIFHYISPSLFFSDVFDASSGQSRAKPGCTNPRGWPCLTFEEFGPTNFPFRLSLNMPPNTLLFRA